MQGIYGQQFQKKSKNRRKTGIKKTLTGHFTHLDQSILQAIQHLIPNLFLCLLQAHLPLTTLLAAPLLVTNQKIAAP